MKKFRVMTTYSWIVYITTRIYTHGKRLHCNTSVVTFTRKTQQICNSSCITIFKLEIDLRKQRIIYTPILRLCIYRRFITKCVNNEQYLKASSEQKQQTNTGVWRSIKWSPAVCHNLTHTHLRDWGLVISDAMGRQSLPKCIQHRPMCPYLQMAKIFCIIVYCYV